MTNRALRLLATFIASAAAAAAEDAPAPSAPAPAAAAASPAAGKPAPDTSDILFVPRSKDYVPLPPTDSDGVTRSVSPGVAAALAEGRPRFSPPTPTPTPAAEVADLRDIDKPKNEIKRLPKYIVRESRPPVFRDQDLFTKEGLIDLTFKRHPGLIFGNFLGLNSSAAYDMYKDDERTSNMNDLADTAHAMAAGGDRAEGSYILQQSQDTYMRQNDSWSWNGAGEGGPQGGAGSK